VSSFLPITAEEGFAMRLGDDIRRIFATDRKNDWKPGKMRIP
jgi:hypothetical protein